MREPTLDKLLHHCHWYWLLLVSVVLNLALATYVAAHWGMWHIIKVRV